LYDRWKRKYLEDGMKGLRSKYKRIDPAVRELEEENAWLKRIIARQTFGTPPPQGSCRPMGGIIPHMLHKTAENYGNL